MRNTVPDALIFPVTFRAEWDDGFGAQGWKLDIATADPNVIACTSYTGIKSQTSVFVHDILDHLVSGFGLSGYVNEARATAMHGIRNGIEIRSSFEYMVDEILGTKLFVGDMDALLPHDVLQALPIAGASNYDKYGILLDKLSHEKLRDELLRGFFRVGISGIPIAYSHWTGHGLLFEKMTAIGLCLQQILEQAERLLHKKGVELAGGVFLVDNEACQFIFALGDESCPERILERVA